MYNGFLFMVIRQASLTLHLSEFPPVCTIGVWSLRKFTTTNAYPYCIVIVPILSNFVNVVLSVQHGDLVL